ncbi:MAG: hypothetical protein V4660_16960 [Pseudomonadota bacterium]
MNHTNSLALTMFYVLFASILSLSAQAQSLKYTYDVLGRVTFVEDATNGNRDYDYDRAGNRTLVAVNTASDSTINGEPSVPPAPTGLIVQGPLSPYGGGYNFSWNPVAGATSYEGQLKDGKPFATTRPQGSSAGPLPDWVRAINIIGRGPLAYFIDPKNPPSSVPRSSSSSSVKPAIDLPTGLSAYRFADCVYKAKWNAVAGATSYEVYDTRGSVQKTAALSVDVACTLGQPESNKPNKVYACSNLLGCSKPAYFF